MNIKMTTGPLRAATQSNGERLSFGCIDCCVQSWTEYEILDQETSQKIGTVLFAKEMTDDPNDAEGPYFEPANGACVSAEQTESINHFIEMLDIYKSKSKLGNIEDVLNQIQNNPLVM